MELNDIDLIEYFKAKIEENEKKLFHTYTELQIYRTRLKELEEVVDKNEESN